MKKIKEMFLTFKRILKSNINYKKIFILGSIQPICEILSFIIFSYIGIDYAFKTHNYSLFLISILIILLVELLGDFSYYSAFKEGNKTTLLVNTNVREKLFKKCMNLDKEYYSNHSTGSIINTLIDDVENVADGFFWNIMELLSAFIDAFLIIIVCMIINFKLSSILLVSVPLIAILVKLIYKGFYKVNNKIKEIVRKRISHINDGIMGIKTIKALNLTDKSNIEYKKINIKEMNFNFKKWGLNQIMWRSVDLISGLSLCILFYLSYGEYNNLSISFGELYLFFLLFERALYSITNLNKVVEEFSNVYVSSRKISEILDTEPLIKDKENAIKKDIDLYGNIEFRNLSFKYPNGEKVLNNFNLQIKQKEKVALVGRTGSGKTTIASLLYRFYEPSKGSIYLDNKDYLEYSLKNIRKNIGFILQDPLLFDDTILNNIKYGKLDASKQEVIEACKKIGLDKIIENMPNKYDTRVGESGLVLSNGQKQLIAFTRVLLTDPKIIILDEATSSIDSKSEKLIQNCIKNQFKDKTCIYIAHRLSTIVNSDKILYIDHGQIIEQGSHKELMKNKGYYYKLYMNQFYNDILDKEEGNL